MKSKYLKEAIRIGNQIIHTAIPDKEGIFWETMERDLYRNISWKKSEDLYAGVSGIVLFLLELYGVTKNKKYLNASQKAMQWVEWYCDNHPTKNYAFLTGRMGVGYTFLKLFQATNNKLYLTKGLRIVKQSSNFLEVPHKKYEYINGFSGTLLGLLHVHAITQDSSILKLIKEYTQVLIQNARLGKVGLYWDQIPEQIRPLCGFSHGASGIGFVFLELGYYFQNPAFYFIAEQAFAYENFYFDEKKNNWPDFRVNMYTEENMKNLEEIYQKGKRNLPSQAEDIFVWCHGAAGIGLSRTRAYELLGKGIYKEDIKRARIKTRLVRKYPFTLCHGHGGNAELFIENKQAEKFAAGALNQKKEFGIYGNGLYIDSYGEDLSLFNGIAGIGYFMLRIYDPKNVSSILAPKLTTQAAQKYTITLPLIKISLIKNIFPNTIMLAQKIAPAQIDEFFKKTDGSKISFRRFMKMLLTTLPKGKKDQLFDIYKYELTKDELNEAIESQARLYIKERLDRKKTQKILKLSVNDLLKQSLNFPSECKIIKTQENGTYLIKQTALGVADIQINPFCALILEAFINTKKVKKALADVVGFLDIKTMEEKKAINEKILLQIREALTYGILS
jgi:hypothetical protein